MILRISWGVLLCGILESSPLAANSPLGNLCGSEPFVSLQRTASPLHSPQGSQPTNLIQDARILESNLPHSYTAKQGKAEVSLVNAGSFDSKIEAKNENLNSPSLRESEANEAIQNIESSDLQNRNKINLHEVQQPQEALSGVRERVVREGEGSDFAIQAPFPSLKVESIENPCEKDSNKNEILESNKNVKLSLRESETNEAIHNTESKSVESSQKSKYLESNTDSKYAKHLDSRLDSHARLLQPSGFAMTESYNDKLTESRLPQNLATSYNDKQYLDYLNDNQILDSRNAGQNLDSHNAKSPKSNLQDFTNFRLPQSPQTQNKSNNKTPQKSCWGGVNRKIAMQSIQKLTQDTTNFKITESPQTSQDSNDITDSKQAKILDSTAELKTTRIDPSTHPYSRHYLAFITQNDAYFDPYTDRYYTAGHSLIYASPEFKAHSDFSWLGFISGVSHFSVSLSQSLYTPLDKYKKEPLVDDHPYAGYLNMGFAWHNRSEQFLESIGVKLGMIGKAAYAKQAQDMIHNAINGRLSQGWDNQVANEFIFNLHYDLTYKAALFDSRFFDIDVLPNVELALGNAQIYAKLGTTLRVGFNLKNTFGAAGITGENGSLNTGRSFSDEFGIFGFVGFQAGAVARNAFIQGNLFSTMPYESKIKLNPLIGSFEFGGSIVSGFFSATYKATLTSREFKGQPKSHWIGSIALSCGF